MKWVTHQIVGAGAAVLAGLPPLAVGAAWLGSIAPDVIDQKVAGLFPNERKAFYAIHRRTTHWLGWRSGSPRLPRPGWPVWFPA